MEDEAILTLAGLLCITLITTVALAKGIDTVLILIAFQLLGGLLGYQVGKRWRITRKPVRKRAR